jgi:hypothetical protein
MKVKTKPTTTRAIRPPLNGLESGAGGRSGVTTGVVIEISSYVAGAAWGLIYRFAATTRNRKAGNWPVGGRFSGAHFVPSRSRAGEVGMDIRGGSPAKPVRSTVDIARLRRAHQWLRWPLISAIRPVIVGR